MKRHEATKQNAAQTQHKLMQWLKKNISRDNKVEMLTLMAKILPTVKPGSLMQHDLIENMVTIMQDAGHIAPVSAIEALSKSVLWVGIEYMPLFIRAIMLLERPALAINPNRAMAAIEEILAICYSVILQRDAHEECRCNDTFLAWQRYTFSTVIFAVETKRSFLDPDLLQSILQISEIMTGLSPKLRDLNEKIKFIAHETKPEHLHWH